jgi:CheY-like chemotaxis protein
MIRLLFVTPSKDSLAGWASALERNKEVESSWAESGGKALDMVGDTPFDLVVTDEFLGDMTGLQLAERMLSVNPMIHCVALSSLSSEEFHEASEGLGLLAQLSAVPDKDQAEELLQRLMDIRRRAAHV